jgi:hypothetical protein
MTLLNPKSSRSLPRPRCAVCAKGLHFQDHTRRASISGRFELILIVNQEIKPPRALPARDVTVHRALMRQRLEALVFQVGPHPA